ncbi:hypothetical protein A3K82_00340 [Candidatus Pacearchaeota archaeon RBG_19FT_COMBO_34_9]|nr:MAG: hypothetical protein A3K82_00340 [Candidatus Pacearchaeota archaeon RBG_19FT_COMBO_34_9]OGJ16216.1 MAG: hypothetical protein A3K74_03255 [Candidatus Pacearchaeota archaeon RBG_13_33_26]
MDKIIFLDRDGTINEDSGHVYRLRELKFIPNMAEGLKKLQNAGYKFIILTNQAGIAKGLYHEQDYFLFREEMHRGLKEQGIIITAEYFCPHHRDGIGKYRIDCNCRKPKTGLLEQAAKDFNLNLNDCWMIGDKNSDILAGKNAGCKTIHVLTGECKTPINYADFIAKDLVEAADYILSQN